MLAGGAPQVLFRLAHVPAMASCRSEIRAGCCCALITLYRRPRGPGTYLRGRTHARTPQRTDLGHRKGNTGMNPLIRINRPGTPQLVTSPLGLSPLCSAAQDSFPPLLTTMCLQSVAAVPEFNKNMWMLFMMLYVGGIIMVAFLTSWPRTVPLVLCGCITPLLLAKRYMGDGFRFVMQALSEVWAAARSAGAKAIMLACICSPWYAFRVLLWVLLWAPPTLCIGTVALMGPYVALLGPMFIFGVVILLAILHRQPPPAEAVANLLWVMADIRSTTGEHLLSFSFVQQAQECGASLLLQWIDCPQWAGPAAGVVCLLGLDSASNSGGVEAEAVAVEE